MQAELPTQSTETDDEAIAAVAEIARALRAKPFESFRFFNSGHGQTLTGYFWPRRFTFRSLRNDEARLFEIEPGVKLLAHCHWQAEREKHPTMVIVHGLEGSSEARYMLGTAVKAVRAGFNAVRLNLRNCGNTEHLAPTLYHSGMSGDVHAIVNELFDRDGLRDIFLVGFSMSGNIVLKLAGEIGRPLAEKVAGVCAVSPSADLHACAAAIERPENWLYQKSFMRSLHSRIRQKAKLFPDKYDPTDIERIRTIRQFDDRYTAADGGFKDANDYYDRSSSLPLIPKIRVPTLIVHAEDDPFIPFDPLRDPSVGANPFVILLSPQRGGHLGFVSKKSRTEDRFWAENRVVEFCGRVKEEAEDRREKSGVRR